MTSLSQFLDDFPVPPPHHTEVWPWVFWTNNNNNPSSPIRGEIMSSFFANANATRRYGYICQFWAPVVTIGGTRVLSTSAQPFAVGFLSKELAMYRQYSEFHAYNIMDDDNDNDMTTAFLNCIPCVNKLEWVLSEVHHPCLNLTILLPVCFKSTCIGVLELTGDFNIGHLGLCVIDNLKKAGLYEYSIQDHIPYQTIDGLKVAKDEIDEALEVVCRSHKLALAQVWIPYEDKNHMPFSSSMEKTQKKRLSALKLTGCSVSAPHWAYIYFCSFCDAIPIAAEELALKTLKDYESRYFPTVYSDMLLDWHGKFFFRKGIRFTICLRSIDTGDFDYAFEFIWTKDSNLVICLEAILLTLKKCLPSFKFASGAELGDELDVKIVTSSDEVAGETEKFKIFQGKRSSPMMKEAAENLHGSECTLALIAATGNDIIKFDLPISQATFVNLEKEISTRLRLSVGTYKLEYFDEDCDWILLTCEEEMGDCIIYSHSPTILLRVTIYTTNIIN